ncbi:Bud site selection protein BUD4 [Podospora aff. communis PSN243]|uniref:Bud site selection protein BUD4 n=1 Tax=Podospora aff. communis PSN243 TaxID=3040156 RepID=A0AAV9H8M2_9PEZI|nr:Bud site selection protein BUD4 [Podospora aff. communis PSN243]
MASEDSVHPLRLTKSNTMPLPKATGSVIPRPLSEISPMEKRRNSPSWNQPTKKMTLNTDSSPFQSSPLDGTTSPRLFWQNRNIGSENQPYGFRSGSPSPTRRSSIERLQKASRVKNSNILALEQKNEYDPTRIPQIERPLREGRPFGHQRSESKTSIPIYNPTKIMPPPPPLADPATARPPTPSKDQVSPIKSSMSTSRFKSSFDHETGTWSGENSINERQLPDGRYLRPHAKSVTFDAAPPQVNEYELATPDISSIGSDSREGSYDSLEDDEDVEHYMIHEGDSHDDSFDASLEDTDKTPVVGPDDWKQDGHNDAYDHSPMPDELPTATRPQHGRTDSTNSNGDHRPLPPLPGMPGAQRSLPSPPPASSTKAETQNIGNGRMPLEERLKLMMLSDDGKTAAEQQRERRMRRAAPRERNESQTPERDARSPSVATDGEEDDTIGDLEEYQLPPRISRESILRRVNGNRLFDRESDYNFSSPAPSSSPERERHVPLDPDVPIPSTEDDEEEERSVIITRNDEQDVDVYSIADDYQDDIKFEKSQKEDGADSQYCDVTPPPASMAEMEEDRSSTPRATTPQVELPVATDKELPAPPSSESEAKSNDFTKGLESFMLAKPDEPVMVTEPEKVADADAQALPRPETPEQRLNRSLTKPEYDGSGWGDLDDEFDEPGTPESVIHHPVSDDSEEEEDSIDSPIVPEQVATIKSASGSKLKTRPSATPSDIMAMREARRQVSREVPVPPIPDRHKNRLSRDMGAEADQLTGDDFLDRHPSFKKRSLTLELDLGLSLDKDFERVIEAQKRGYLMRQNTKLVAASDKHSEDARGYRSAGNSPVKASRPQSWTVEPWNPQVRKRSSVRKRADTGPAPPLPGHESNATALNSLNEEDIGAELATEESGERGRLFVKVMGVKDLDLPIPKNERTWFSLTLDNGVHCVTTAWLELARNAPIGQEFELVVPNDLEFQLTLNVKLEKPAPKKVILSPTKVSKPKTSAFSRVFASPKKRKEMEQRQREEEERLAQQQRDAQARQMSAHPTAWDLLSPLAAEDGSFARSYVCLKEHEPRCFGRPYLVEVAAFNEWATEEAGFASSVKSKRGNTAVVRRAPYKIGKLELQLLFVPRPKGATDDDMPKSMNSCIREMKAAEERLSQQWEGHLSQQGGDCPYWRRRYFKLVGTKLTAYHEATRQPRATINLANAKRLIDDRRALTEKETTGKGGKRRRSAFAEEEDGYMFVEEGFRIRFNNGELIDFYADSTQDKDGWMKVLSEVINRDSAGGAEDDMSMSSRPKGKWCELVLKREDTIRRRAEGRRVHSRTKSMYV